MDTRELLNAYTKTTLNVIARHLGLRSMSKDRTVLIDDLVQAMGDKATVQRAVEALTSTGRALLQCVQLAGGELGVGALRVLAARDGLIDPKIRPTAGRVSPVANSPVFEEQVAWLTAHGLLLTTGQRSYGGLLGFELASTLVIPAPVLPLLPSLPQAVSALNVSPPPVIRSADSAALQRDLYLYWSFVRDNPLALTSRSLVNKGQLKKVNSLLSQSESLDNVRDENDTRRLRFLRHLLLECGLVERSGDSLVASSAGDAFFARSLAARTRAAFDAYRKASFWDELLQVPCLVIEGRRTSRVEAPAFVVAGRNKLLDMLATLPSEGWLALDAMIDQVRRRNYEFLLPRRASPYGYNTLPPNPYVSYGNDLGWSFYAVRPGQQTYEGYIRNEADGWDVVEGGMVEAMLREPLYWLGLLDLGTTPDPDAEGGQKLVAVRPTSLGAHILMGAPLPENESLPSGRLIVQPTFQILAYPPVSEVQLALLDRIAERGRLEQVAEYRLTRDSLYRARQQHGLAAEQVIEALERESGAALPQNVRYTLIEWGQAQERVVLSEEVTLLTVAEEGHLDKLLADQASARHIARRLTPTAALVDAHALDALEQQLYDEGQLPLRFDQPPDLERGGQWIDVVADGSVTLLPAAPALFLRRALRAFSSEEGTAWRITRPAVQQALADGLALEALLERLAVWSGGALEPSVETQIKAWGGFFGSAQIERPVLLRLQDERVLQTLLDDPEVASLLRVYRPAAVLAEVDPEQVATLQELLIARGVALTDGQSSQPSASEATSEPRPPRSKAARRGG